MIWRVPETEVFELCAANGISQIVWSPLAQGVLSGKYEPGAEPPADSRAASEEMGAEIGDYMRDDVLEAVQRLRPIADEAGLTMVQLALAWTLRRDELAAAIIGATRPQQVHDNVVAAGVELSADVLAAVDEALGDVVVRDPEQVASAESPVRHR
jgi:aryl-alcohol dehydrogenase-like predicted oxidoreductase